MAAAFPYRGVPGGMPPGIHPPAQVPDYMSEEKLQEKGGFSSRGSFDQCVLSNVQLLDWSHVSVIYQNT